MFRACIFMVVRARAEVGIVKGMCVACLYHQIGAQGEVVPGPAGGNDHVSWSAGLGLPATRARGQDDSSELPQINDGAPQVEGVC